MPALYGIIGFPLTHSFSPAYFKKKFAEQHIDASYEAFSINDVAQFPALIDTHPTLNGLSVTIPYKQAIISYLDEVDGVATEVGAVNCISIKNGKKKGYNTDVIGFEQSLIPLLHPPHTHALIFGTGGASKAVAWVLKQLGIPYQLVSRKAQDDCLTYNDLTSEIINHHKLIINTTPLGMYPHTDAAPSIPYDAIGTHHLLYDLIYNPGETKFLSLGKAHGAAIKNGFEMLHLQADDAWNIWTTTH
jgi:shikimate dehydrogenase